MNSRNMWHWQVREYIKTASGDIYKGTKHIRADRFPDDPIARREYAEKNGLDYFKSMAGIILSKELEDGSRHCWLYQRVW